MPVPWKDETPVKELVANMKEQLDEVSVFDDCELKLREPGNYLARITVAGGYQVPLKVRIEKRDFTPKDLTKTRWIRTVVPPPEAVVTTTAAEVPTASSSQPVD
mmetsp:Transcript_18525/g.27517  ORF Transcript_18525/g.27517 Transcript_18525/m.27517 type:complete len:104 (-) Transcript_18525:75-386(-)